MYSFKNITKTNGFDLENLQNAKQNNYAWSMAELGDYIYVGTGRNVPLIAIKSINKNIKIPDILKPTAVDNLAEIWRYKIDGSLPWTRVYKATPETSIAGFRFMLKANDQCGAPCLYAASFGPKVALLQSYDGINWFILDTTGVGGTSSRYMVEMKGKIYLATVDDISSQLGDPMLYSNTNPEFNSWTSVIGTEAGKNPNGAISSMAVFNNHLYVGTSYSKGIQVWKSNSEEPKANDWTLVVDKGFGDASNKICLSMGTFKNRLYVSGTKPLPLSWAIPFGVDIIMIDKNDNWQLVVGGPALQPTIPTRGLRGLPISGYLSGFNNPFNVYAWQIQEYNDNLFISTFDDSINMNVILDTIKANKTALINEIGEESVEIIIGIYSAIVCTLKAIKYPIGFDMYVSSDGIHFTPVFKNGLGNPYNYGGRMLFVSDENEFFIGTANPFLGCEVWKMGALNNCFDENETPNSLYRNNYAHLSTHIKKHFDLLEKHLPIIEKYLPDHF